MHLTGSCQRGCGACCRVVVLPLPGIDALHQTDQAAYVPLPLNLDQRTAAFYDARGIEAVLSTKAGGAVARVPLSPGKHASAFKVSDGWFARVPSVCPHLRVDGECRIYDQRPEVCRNGPTLWERLHVLGTDCAIDVVE